MHTLTDILNHTKNLFEKENFTFQPEGLYAPIDYTLRLGGKRIRPVMLMIANEMFGGNLEDVEHAALGIETFHNFTLLHDDLMDKSPIRRGKSTVYRKWNENTAILSGDTMFAMAWRFFLRKNHSNLCSILNCFNDTAIEVCEGQQYDMEFETRNDVTINEYLEMIRLKTAVLLAGALKIGGLFANAPTEDLEHLYQFGIQIGLAFQLQDDLLDTYGDTATFGKQTGTDIKDNKKTYLYLKALELATTEQKSQLQSLFSTTPVNPANKIAKVLDIYNQIGIQSEVEKAINNHFSAAQNELAAIRISEDKKSTLKSLADTLLRRKK